ncbi:hypothetical protein OKW96_14910 [Sphingobacterium sp. KU25419]|nr:hypothetical protein OKW96_14910 [Sphingobacterium sp. KU25419]
MGKEMASGLSGSGVYIIRGNSLYLIGHLLDVTGKIAFNDDVNCCRFSNLKSKFGEDKWVNLSDLGQLKEWENNSEDKIEDADIQNWIDTNDAYFDNLLRKAKVLYSDSKATKIARERLIEFLVQEYKNSKIRGMGNFIEQFEKAASSLKKW